MSKTKEIIKNDEVLQAVLITDDFSDNFQPLTKNTPLVLLPLVNTPLIDYTLEFLALGGVEQTFVFCASHCNAIKNHINNAKKSAIWANIMDVQILVSEQCSSLGDCLREIDARGVIRGSFVLVEPGVISNMKLLPMLQKFAKTIKKDKGATMSLVMQQTGMGQNGLCSTEETLIVTNDNNQVLLHRRLAQQDGDSNKIKFPLDMFMEHWKVNILHNIRDTHVTLCGPSVLPLFADNFDYQTRWDFIRGIMMVDEVDDSTIYCHILEDGQMGGAVTSWHMYHALSWDVISGWFYPLSPKLKTLVAFGTTVVKGKNCLVDASSILVNCILGDNVKIGKNVSLKNAIIFSNTSVEDFCIVDQSVIGGSATVRTNTTLKSTIIGDEVILEDNTHLENTLIQANSPDEDMEFEKLSNSAYKIIPESEFTIHPKQLIDNFEDGFNTTDSEDESTSSLPDDSKMFFSEVTDSLARGIEDKLQCNNLILEINSSRYAYNVSLKEVNYYVPKAILSLPFQLEDGAQYLPALSRCLAYFSPILKNYIRDEESMSDCLEAVEDIALANNELSSCITKVLNWLYDQDFLTEDAITDWFDNLDKTSTLHAKVQPFVKWLEEAEEETSDDD